MILLYTYFMLLYVSNTTLTKKDRNKCQTMCNANRNSCSVRKTSRRIGSIIQAISKSSIMKLSLLNNNYNDIGVSYTLNIGVAFWGIVSLMSILNLWRLMAHQISTHYINAKHPLKRQKWPILVGLVWHVTRCTALISSWTYFVNINCQYSYHAKKYHIGKNEHLSIHFQPTVQN